MTLFRATLQHLLRPRVPKATQPLHVEGVCAVEFFRGWWQGGAVIGINGVIIGYLLGRYL